MKIGLLWFDDDPRRDLAEKIIRAARRHREKYGTAPDTCYIHTSALSGNGNTANIKVGQIQVATLPTVLPHHFWIGQEEEHP